ncbi:MAG: hypothetical protein ABS92_01765 [Thiobacillus sp. SCN 63-374]|nr:MAG: hypothetical protein ABS92_01765 [Thiobacillus sp. SCN 63-374]
MKLKSLSLALAAALVTSPAFAALGDACVGGDTTCTPESISGVVKIVLSGATAPDGFIESSVKEMLESASIKSYRDNATATAFAHRAWYGLAKAGIPGVTAGTPVLFVKRSSGGSVWGVDPVARGSRIESLNFAACTQGGAATGDGSKVYDYVCATKGLDPNNANFTNPALNNGVISDFGVSDVSPALFKAPYNVEFGQNQLSAAEVSRLTIKPVNTVIMGLAVTNAVPLSTTINRADYGNMLMGNVYDWTQIGAGTGTNDQVVACRRVNGSGTQASYNWFFNNFPCQSAFAGAVAPTSMGINGSGGDNASGIVSGTGTPADRFVIDPTAGYTVVNNSTSGDVRNCLMNAQNHTDHNFQGDDGKYYTVKFSNSGSPFKAIGVLSADSYGSESGWAFRNMGGAGSFAPATQTGSAGATGTAPSKASLLSGAWDFAVELTMQYRKVAVTNPQGDAVAALAGVKKSFADELIKRAGDPAKIAVNTKKNVYAALPDYYDPTANAVNTANVALGSHQGNMCQPLVRKY